MKVEMCLVGPLDAAVRQNMLVDVRAACAYSVMATIITFIPIILRRSGATSLLIILPCSGCWSPGRCRPIFKPSKPFSPGWAKALGLDAADHLSRNDAQVFFQALGDLIKTGPTGTNVNGLIFWFLSESVFDHLSERCPIQILFIYKGDCSCRQCLSAKPPVGICAHNHHARGW
jgi:hypothetical protein